MKILLEHDETGAIKAVLWLPRSSESEGHTAPVRRAGQHFAEMDMPTEMAEVAAQLESGKHLVEAHARQLRALIAQFRLDTTQKPPKLLRKGASQR